MSNVQLSLLPAELSTRQFSLGNGSSASGTPSSLDTELRLIKATVATESPVPMPDFSRGEMVDEVLLMSGADLPGRVPLLNSHNRSDVADVLGSVSGFRVEGGQLVAAVKFADTQAADDAFRLAADGHLSDLSVGYRVMQKTYIRDGESKVVAGRSFNGPVNVVTAFAIREVSVTPLGADASAKFRSEGKVDMTQQVASNAGATVANGTTIGSDVAKRAELNDFAFKECERQNVADCYGEIVAQNLPDAGAIGRAIWTKSAERRPIVGPWFGDDSHIGFGADQSDKFRAAAAGGLICRIAGNIDPAARKRALGTEHFAAGFEDFSKMTLLRLAETCLRQDGVRTDRMTGPQIAQAALGFGQRSVFGPGYHTPGSLASVTLDAANKSLLLGYGLVAPTWSLVARTGPSAQDFKNLYRVRLGEVPNLEAWPTNETMNQVALKDERESYAVEAYADEISFSWKLIVNDDQAALTRIPMQLGIAAARTVNATFWATVTANPTMQDAVAFFSTATGNRKKANYTSSGAAPSVAQVAVGKNLMRQQVGVNKPDNSASDQVLNIAPRFLIVPSALETTGQQLLLSPWDPASNSFMRYNPAGALQLVVEPLLDATSTVQWYMAADPNLWDGFEMTFLAGQEQPVIRNFQDERTWAMVYQVVQSFACAAIDFRSWYKDAGQ